MLNVIPNFMCVLSKERTAKLAMNQKQTQYHSEEINQISYSFHSRFLPSLRLRGASTFGR